MTDVRTAFRAVDDAAPVADWAVEGGGLAMDTGLETGITLSIFTERDAEDGDDTDGDSPRRWWGQTYWPVLLGLLGLVVPPDMQFGSRLWLLRRAKETEDTRNRAEFYVRECLPWLVTFQIAASVEVTAQWIGPGELGLVVDVVKADGTPVRYENFWRNA